MVGVISFLLVCFFLWFVPSRCCCGFGCYSMSVCGCAGEDACPAGDEFMATLHRFGGYSRIPWMSLLDDASQATARRVIFFFSLNFDERQFGETVLLINYVVYESL
uniref:Putative secreted protein n=1 Tax=Anopheles triannulatus TaxID=58253 RepID=A0A2M4B790_9DIPT